MCWLLRESVASYIVASGIIAIVMMFGVHKQLQAVARAQLWNVPLPKIASKIQDGGDLRMIMGSWVDNSIMLEIRFEENKLPIIIVVYFPRLQIPKAKRQTPKTQNP